MPLAPVSPSEILWIIRSLRGNSASVFDRVHTKVLKAVASSIIEPLTYLINLSLQKGTFPKWLKEAIIVPLHKGVSGAHPANYRPISILSVFLRVLKKTCSSSYSSFWRKKGFLILISLGFDQDNSHKMY